MLLRSVSLSAVVAGTVLMGACLPPDDPAPPTSPPTTPAPTTPVAPAGGSRLDPASLSYVGAFRVPTGRFGTSTFAFGGHGLAWRPGDPADPFPGTLFAVGHEQEQQVAEFDIPAPVASHDPGRLPVASFVQPFTDVTGGLGPAATAGEMRVGDIEFLDGRLHWSVYRWYNVGAEQLAGHGWSNADFGDLDAHGTWTLGAYHNQLTGGYLLTAPQAWADAHTSGRRLIAGLTVRQGVASTSQGPALFAYSDAQAVASPPPGSALDTTALLYYPHADGQTSTPDPIPAGGATLTGHLIPESWRGATWVEAGGRQAVLVVGRRASVERYGEPEPGDCEPDKGYHGDPYRPVFALYDPDDLAAVAAGAKRPWEVQPYAEIDPSADLIPSCGWDLSGAAFDAEHSLLYVIHQGADVVSAEFEPYPVVYVYRVG